MLKPQTAGGSDAFPGIPATGTVAPCSLGVAGRYGRPAHPAKGRPGGWRVFTEAGRPGWAAAVPLYHWYVLMKVVGRPGWWTALLLIPLVNLIVWLRLAVDLGRSFGKTTAFAVLWLLPLTGHVILGFGNAHYRGSYAARQERCPVASDRG